MSKKAIIHMGLPKTGTTTIQNVLYKNRDWLLKKYKYYYPSVEANHTNFLCIMFLPDPRTHVTVKMRGLTTDAEVEALRAECFKRLEAEIESANWETLVFSAEGLANLSSDSLMNFQKWLSRYVDSCEVIYWVRHPLDFTKSLMQQMIKGGETIEDMMKRLPLTNFKGRLNNAVKAFGKSSIHLETFENSRAEKGGIVASFCRQLGLDEKGAMAMSDAAVFENESMSMLATMVFNTLNRRRPMFVDGKFNTVRRQGEFGWISRLKGEKFDLLSAQKHQICIQSRSDVRWLNEAFDLNLYEDVFEDDPAKFSDPNEIYDQKTLDSIALVMSDLMNR